MSKLSRAMAYLIAANFQMVGIAVFSYWLGKYLNENYPFGFNWFYVSFIFGGLSIIHTFYMVFKSLIRLEKKS